MQQLTNPNLLGPVLSQAPLGDFTTHLCLEQDLICPEQRFLGLSLFFFSFFDSLQRPHEASKHEGLRGRFYRVAHYPPAPFIHVTAFPQRCAHIKFAQPCHLHRSVCTDAHTPHTYTLACCHACVRGSRV